MMKRVGLFFGGMGNEAEISIKSAKNIVENFDRKKYGLVLIYWDKKGTFYYLSKIDDFKKIRGKKLVSPDKIKKLIDIAFPITHGKYGEDGVIQSFFELHHIKYCGCRVASSALCMDKAIFKTLISGKGINQTKFEIIDADLMTKKEIKNKLIFVRKNLKLPLFVKPSGSGSSVGITKVKKMSEVEKALVEAFRHDRKIIIEEGLMNHREIEVAVLGNKKLIISEPGELKVPQGFYDFDEKYNLNRTETKIPARLDEITLKEIKKLAGKAYKLCFCSGFARVDFFLSKNKIYLNEINTLPGFTDISMFPMLLGAKGLKYGEIINKIIELA